MTDLFMLIAKILYALVNVLTVVTTIYALYQLYISIFLFSRYETSRSTSKHLNKFALIISAHDEEAVIANLINSLKKQNYPKDKYDIFIIADNCSDNTASISRENGAIVYERFNPAKKSKGYALNWFFEKFLKDYPEGSYEVCTIIDADNVIDKNFLIEKNHRFNLGERVVVGYRVGKNPSDSIISNVNSLFWVMQNRGADHPRYVTGRSLMSVGGTGFSFAIDIIRQSGWHYESLTEDLEFSMDMNLKGEKITYCREAVFYDEQPVDLSSTIKQRWRWSYGTKELLSLKSMPLFKSIFNGRRDNIDSFVFSITYLALLIGPIIWVSSLGLGAIIRGSIFWLIKTILISAVTSQIAISLFIWVLCKLEEITWDKQWQGILAYPAFLMVITVTVYLALFKKPGWKKIAHSDQRTIEEMGTS